MSLTTRDDQELKTKTRDEKRNEKRKSCVKRDILLRRRIFPKIESEARLETIRAVFFSLHHAAGEEDPYLTLTLDDDIFLIDEIFRICENFRDFL